MLNSNRRGLVLGTAAAGLTSLASRSQAQSAGWPNRPVRLIVAFAPGGLTDAYARLYAEQFTAKYNQPCVVENRPGAGGNIAIEAMVKAPADGYTLLCSTSGAVWQNRVLYRKLPFDLAKDIVPVTIYPSGGLVVAVAPNVPVKNFNEFVDWARKNQATMGSYAPASVPHMLAEAFNKDYGTKLQTVHYKGEAPMWLDIASNQTQIAVGSYQAVNTVLDKGVRPIAITGNVRLPKLPNLPSLLEQGMKGDLSLLEGGLPITARSGTPEDILDKLAQVAIDGIDTPRAKALRESFGIPDVPKTRAETQRIWREIAPIWIRQAEALNVKLD